MTWTLWAAIKHTTENRSILVFRVYIRQFTCRWRRSSFLILCTRKMFANAKNPKRKRLVAVNGIIKWWCCLDGIVPFVSFRWISNKLLIYNWTEWLIVSVSNASPRGSVKHFGSSSNELAFRMDLRFVGFSVLCDCRLMSKRFYYFADEEIATGLAHAHKSIEELFLWKCFYHFSFNAVHRKQ